jgi:serine protease Do
MSGSSLIRFLLLLLTVTSVAEAGDRRPVTLDALAKTQSAVQAQLPVVEKALIALDSRTSAASGVIISPDGLVLTAGHVVHGMLEAGAQDGMCHVILADGSRATAKILGRDLATDAGMMQLVSGRRDWPHVKLGRALDAVRVGNWCFALGHPGGRDAARGPVLRVGRVLKLSTNAVQTDCVLMGGDSGGPLFNLSGELIGIHSQIWEGRDQNAHVSLAPFLRAWDKLLKGEIIPEDEGGAWLGVATATTEKKEGLLVEAVAEQSPAQLAGLQEGDAILSADGQALRGEEDLARVIACHSTGESLPLRVSRSTGMVELRVKLSQRPAQP